MRSFGYSVMIRTIKTIAETAVGVIGGAAYLGAVDWKLVVSSAILAGIVTMLSCVPGLPEVRVDE